MNEFTPTDSSIIQKVEYNKKTKIMNITFNTGAKYSYSGVDFKTYLSMSTSDSVGSFFHRTIRNNYDKKLLET